MSEAERHALLLALAAADGQSWGSIAEASEHTAEVMYGKQADAVGQIIAQRTADLAAKVAELEVMGDHSSCVEAYSNLAAKVAAVEAVTEMWTRAGWQRQDEVITPTYRLLAQIRAALRGDQP